MGLTVQEGQIIVAKSSTIKWIESYLSNRKQFVEVSGKRSSEQEVNIGTPQGSRLSPLLFIILMADLDLWTENSSLSNFADDTQSISQGKQKKIAGNSIK